MPAAAENGGNRIDIRVFGTQAEPRFRRRHIANRKGHVYALNNAGIVDITPRVIPRKGQ